MHKPAFIIGRSAGLAVTCALAGCNLGPYYHQPQVPAPQQWTRLAAEPRPSADAATDSSSPTPATWPADDWWHSFGSTELDGLIDQAGQANDDLRAAVARVQQADAQVRIAGAALLPDLSAGFAPQRARQLSPSTGLPATGNTFAASLSASYELDFWGKNLALREAAVAQALGSRYDRATVGLSITSGVANTYFTALSLQQRLQLAVNNLANARQTLQGLQLEQQVGTVTALDVAQQQALVDSQDATIPALRAQLSHQLAALAILLGRTPDGLNLSQPLDGMTAPLPGAGLPAELLTRRPDVASAEAQLIAANADVRAARAAFLPNIALTASGGFESTMLSTLLQPASRIFSIGADVTQPIFAGGLLAGQYAQNKARYEELLADYHKAVISAFGNVEDALTTVQETAEQQRRQDRAAQSAARAYDFAQTQFHAGTINILSVLNTESTLFSAQDALAQARLANLTAVVGLYQALGGGWQQQQEHR